MSLVCEGDQGFDDDCTLSQLSNFSKTYFEGSALARGLNEEIYSPFAFWGY